MYVVELEDELLTYWINTVNTISEISGRAKGYKFTQSTGSQYGVLPALHSIRS